MMSEPERVEPTTTTPEPEPATISSSNIQETEQQQPHPQPEKEINDDQTNNEKISISIIPLSITTQEVTTTTTTTIVGESQTITKPIEIQVTNSGKLDENGISNYDEAKEEQSRAQQEINPSTSNYASAESSPSQANSLLASCSSLSQLTNNTNAVSTTAVDTNINQITNEQQQQLDRVEIKETTTTTTINSSQCDLTISNDSKQQNEQQFESLRNDDLMNRFDEKSFSSLKLNSQENDIRQVVSSMTSGTGGYFDEKEYLSLPPIMGENGSLRLASINNNNNNANSTTTNTMKKEMSESNLSKLSSIGETNSNGLLSNMSLKDINKAAQSVSPSTSTNTSPKVAKQSPVITLIEKMLFRSSPSTLSLSSSLSTSSTLMSTLPTNDPSSLSTNQKQQQPTYDNKLAVSLSNEAFTSLSSTTSLTTSIGVVSASSPNPDCSPFKLLVNELKMSNVVDVESKNEISSKTTTTADNETLKLNGDCSTNNQQEIEKSSPLSKLIQSPLIISNSSTTTTNTTTVPSTTTATTTNGDRLIESLASMNHNECEQVDPILSASTSTDVVNQTTNKSSNSINNAEGQQQQQQQTVSAIIATKAQQTIASSLETQTTATSPTLTTSNIGVPQKQSSSNNISGSASISKSNSFSTTQQISPSKQTASVGSNSTSPQSSSSSSSLSPSSTMQVPASSQEFCMNLRFDLAAAAASTAAGPIVVQDHKAVLSPSSSANSLVCSDHNRFTSNASTSSIHNDLKMILEESKEQNKKSPPSTEQSIIPPSQPQPSQPQPTQPQISQPLISQTKILPKTPSTTQLSNNQKEPQQALQTETSQVTTSPQTIQVVQTQPQVQQNSQLKTIVDLKDEQKPKPQRTNHHHNHHHNQRHNKSSSNNNNENANSKKSRSGKTSTNGSLNNSQNEDKNDPQITSPQNVKRENLNLIKMMMQMANGENKSPTLCSNNQQQQQVNSTQTITNEQQEQQQQTPSQIDWSCLHQNKDNGRYRYTKEFLLEIRDQRNDFIDQLYPDLFKAYCYCMNGKYWDPEKYFDIGEYEKIANRRNFRQIYQNFNQNNNNHGNNGNNERKRQNNAIHNLNNLNKIRSNTSTPNTMNPYDSPQPLQVPKNSPKFGMDLTNNNEDLVALTSFENKRLENNFIQNTNSSVADKMLLNLIRKENNNKQQQNNQEEINLSPTSQNNNRQESAIVNGANLLEMINHNNNNNNKKSSNILDTLFNNSSSQSQSPSKPSTQTVQTTTKSQSSGIQQQQQQTSTSTKQVPRHFPLILTAQELEMSQLSGVKTNLPTANQKINLRNKFENSENNFDSNCSEAYKQLVKNLSNHPLNPSLTSPSSSTSSAKSTTNIDNLIAKLQQQQKQFEKPTEAAASGSKLVLDDATNILKQLLNLSTKKDEKKNENEKKSEKKSKSKRHHHHHHHHHNNSNNNKSKDGSFSNTQPSTSATANSNLIDTTNSELVKFPSVNPHERPFENFIAEENRKHIEKVVANALSQVLNKQTSPSSSSSLNITGDSPIAAVASNQISNNPIENFLNRMNQQQSTQIENNSTNEPPINQEQEHFNSLLNKLRPNQETSPQQQQQQDKKQGEQNSDILKWFPGLIQI